MNTALHVKERVHATEHLHECTVTHGVRRLGLFFNDHCDIYQASGAIMEHMRHPPLNETEPIETQQL